MTGASSFGHKDGPTDEKDVKIFDFTLEAQHPTYKRKHRTADVCVESIPLPNFHSFSTVPNSDMPINRCSDYQFSVGIKHYKNSNISGCNIRQSRRRQTTEYTAPVLNLTMLQM